MVFFLEIKKISLLVNQFKDSKTKGVKKVTEHGLNFCNSSATAPRPFIFKNNLVNLTYTKICVPSGKDNRKLLTFTTKTASYHKSIQKFK